ncbi:MAG: hypothetical protein QHH04_08970 [Methanolinea sp.]|nr:hypothetical protein [Methanolinea sp.]
MERCPVYPALVLLLVTLLMVTGCIAPLTQGGEGRKSPGGTPGIMPVPTTPRQVQETVTVAAEMPVEAERSTRPLVHGAKYRAGDTLAISGETILSPGNHVLVQVTPLAFGPTKKGASLPVSGASGVVPVTRQEGASFSRWSFEFDTTGWEPGEYGVRVQGIEVPAFSLDVRFALAPAG